jgi:hypothetical protein
MYQNDINVPKQVLFLSSRTSSQASKGLGEGHLPWRPRRTPTLRLALMLTLRLTPLSILFLSPDDCSLGALGSRNRQSLSQTSLLFTSLEV